MKIKIVNSEGHEIKGTFRISTTRNVNGRDDSGGRIVDAWRCPTERTTEADDLTLEIELEAHELDMVAGRPPRGSKQVLALRIDEGKIVVEQDTMGILTEKAGKTG